MQYNKFTTSNYYIKYKLYDHLISINKDIFSGYSFLLDNTITSGDTTDITYYDQRPNPNIYPTTKEDSRGTLIKLTTDLTQYFRKNTFVNLKLSGSYPDPLSEGDFIFYSIIRKTLIVDLVPNEYIVIETHKPTKPPTGDLTNGSNVILNVSSTEEIVLGMIVSADGIPSDTTINSIGDDSITLSTNATSDITGVTLKIYSTSEMTFNSISTIYGLKDISDILYDVYINEESDYYRVRDDNRRRSICNSYAEIISGDINIKNYTTAILMQDYDNKFVLKIYDPENLANGGIGRPPIVFTSSTPTENVGMYYAIVKGTVTDNGGNNITEWGIYWGSTINPNIKQIADTVPNGQPGTFSTSIVNLIYLTNYYYKVYAINKNGISYGTVDTFITKDKSDSPPVVETIGSQNISSYSMSILGRVISTGYKSGSPSGYTEIDYRGIEYAEGITDTFTDTVIYTNENGKVGSYYCTLTGLTPLQEYSYRAFATNIDGYTGTGTTGHTMTLAPIPPVVDTLKYSTTSDSITYSCQLVSDGGTLCTEVGWCYNNTGSPTTGDTCVVYHKSPPYKLPLNYSITETGLSSGIYYVRGYAKNSYVVGYGILNIIIIEAPPV